MVVICTWLSGAGIVTQPAFQAIKGLHDSIHFTLSLPVSRFRLLAVRAGLGWLEVAGYLGTFCCGIWFVPTLRRTVTPVDMFECAVALVACLSTPYFVSVLLATFLDDQWRMKGTMISFGALWALLHWIPWPASVDFVRALTGDRSPLMAHTLPWPAIGVSMALSATLFFAALKIVQAREY
jgi:hypothetical protein